MVTEAPKIKRVEGNRILDDNGDQNEGQGIERNIMQGTLEGDDKQGERLRSRRKNQKPKALEDYVVDMNSDENDDVLFSLLTYGDSVPETYEEILQRNDKNEWLSAIVNEIQVLKEKWRDSALGRTLGICKHIAEYSAEYSA
ncbi:hypothetical protein ACJJTC_010373 [Scirpophaga incertulas]